MNQITLNYILQTIGVAIIVLAAGAFMLYKIFRKPKQGKGSSYCNGCSLASACSKKEKRHHRFIKGKPQRD